MDTFAKELVHDFGPKFAIFQYYFLGNLNQEKILWYSKTKNQLSGLKNRNFKKSNNWDLSKGVSPWFWSKIRHISNFFLGNKS